MLSHHLNYLIDRKIYILYIFIFFINKYLIIIFSLTILVNRGWVSMINKDPASRISGQIAGQVELEGIVRLNEPRPQFVTKNVTDSRFWSYR